MLLPLLLLGAGRLFAQTLEVAVEAGYLVPAADQFTRLVVVPTNAGFGVDTAIGRHDPGLALGATASIWPTRRFGLELGASIRRTDRSLATVTYPHLGLRTASRSAAVTAVALRGLVRGYLGPLAVCLGAGPAVVHFGGAAYEPGGVATSRTQLAGRAAWGGTLLVDGAYPVWRRVGLRLRVEDAMYRVRMVALPPGDTTRTPLQHDLVVSIGVVLGLRTP
jgi:hypothetical protein